jgi:hypothetical protein
MLKHWRSIVTLGFIVASSASLWWWASSGYPTQSEICEPPGTTNNCERYNILFALAWNAAKKLDPWSVLISAIATGVIAWFTITLARMSKRQIADSRSIQRAHVFVLRPEAELLAHATGGEIYGARLKVIWKNSGTTPATQITAMTGSTWVQSIEQFNFGTGGAEQQFILGPGAEIAGNPVVVGNPLAFFNHQGHQFMWGWVRYRDIFPKSRTHVVEFCFGVTVEGNLAPQPNPLPRINFTFHGEHNRYYEE